MLQTKKIKPGHKIAGRYEAINLIGQGATSQVYRVRDLSDGKELALKYIIDPIPGIHFIQNEFKFLSSLQHPNLVQVYNFGKDQASYFYTMELVAGGSLFDRSLKIEAVVDAAAQLCLVLEYIHGQDILHLDLKPGNILVSAEGRIKLADFGFAQCYSGQKSLKIFGSPAYISPEMISGQTPDHRSDLYSLGVILYQMSTGRLPFEALTMEQQTSRHLSQVPIPPRTVNSDVPEALDRLICKMLSKDASDRPASANEVIEELNHGLGLQLPLAADTGRKKHVLLSKMAGREKELRELRQALLVAQSGQGNCIFISGETGIGRTRLLSEFATQAQLGGANVFWSRCYQESTAAFQPIDQLMAQLAPLARCYCPETLTKYGPEIIEIVPSIGSHIESRPKSSPGSLPETDKKLRVLDLMARFIIETTASLPQSPSLVIFEGIHRADSETIDMILHLGRNISKEAILLVGSFRSDELDEFHPLIKTIELLASENRAEQLYLKRLNLDEVSRLVEGVFPRSRNLEILTGELFRKTEGNPFLIEEAINYLMGSGQIRREAGRWLIDPLLSDASDLPKNIREIWEGKINSLLPVQTLVLKVLAVIGKPATENVIAEISGIPAEQVSEHLIHLKSRSLLTSIAEQEETVFDFHHSKIEQFIYQNLEPALARELHRQAAVLLEKKEVKSCRDFVELARHWERAQEPGLSAGCHLAAARQLRGYTSQQAIEHYRSALSLSPAVSRQEILPELAELLYQSGNYQDSLEISEELISPEADGTDIRRLRGSCFRAMGRSEDAFREYAIALELAVPDPVPAARAYAAMAEAYRLTGEYVQAERICQNGLKLLPPESNLLVEAELYNGLGQAYWHLAEWAQSITAHQKSLRLKELAGDKFGIADSYDNLGSVYYRMYEWDRAADCHRMSFSLREEIGDICGLAKSFNNLALIYRHLYDWDEAMEYHGKCLQILERIGSNYEMAVTRTNLGFIHKARGEIDQALWNYNQGIQIALKIDAKSLLLDAYIKKAELYLTMGSLKDVSLFCQKALELSEILGGKLELGRGLNIQGRIYLMKRQWDKARETLSKALEVFTELDIKAGEAFILKNLAELHQGLGETEEAGRLAEKALRLAQRVEEQQLVSEILLLKGELLEEAGGSGIKYLEWALETAGKVRIQETTGFIYGSMARHYARYKNTSQAVEYYQKSIAVFKQTCRHISQPELKNNYLREPRIKEILREVQQLYQETVRHDTAG